MSTANMSRDANAQLSSAVHGSEAGATVIIAIIAIAATIVSAVLAYGAWMVHEIIKTASARKRERILRRPCRSRASENATLELGNAFTKSESCEPEPFVFPYFRPHNLAAYFPSPPPRAYVAGKAPFSPPGLPPCRVLGAAKTPVVVAHCAGGLLGIKAIIGHTGDCNSSPQLHAQEQLPSESPKPMTDRSTPGWGAVGMKDPSMPTNLRGLGLEFDDICVNSGSEVVNHDVLTEGTRHIDFKGGIVEQKDASVDKLRVPLPTAPFATSAQLPLSPLIPTLPTLVITSASINHGLATKRATLEVFSSQLPSPPSTPTLVVTAPSIHCGLNLEVERRVEWAGFDDDLENWSDVLGLEEYEAENYFSLGNTSICTPAQLPSPPQTPIPNFTPTLPMGPVLLPASAKSGECTVALTARDGEPTEETKDKAEEGFDLAAFHTRLAAFTRAKEVAKVAQILTVYASDVNGVKADASPAPSQGMGFDYERLLARKRAACLSTEPPLLNPRAHPVQVLAPIQSAARLCPLPADFQPLLLRSVDRSKLKSHTS